MNALQIEEKYKDRFNHSTISIISSLPEPPFTAEDIDTRTEELVQFIIGRWPQEHKLVESDKPSDEILERMIKWLKVGSSYESEYISKEYSEEIVEALKDEDGIEEQDGAIVYTG